MKELNTKNESKIAVIFDTDGTLAHMKGRRGPFDWNKVDLDDPDNVIIKIARMYHFNGTHQVIIFSGRDESCRDLTIKWLDKHVVPFTELHMRPAGNNEKDSIVKERMIRDVLTRYSVECIFDDRDQCVKLWRDLGFKCLQVRYGDF